MNDSKTWLQIETVIRYLLTAIGPLLIMWGASQATADKVVATLAFLLGLVLIVGPMLHGAWRTNESANAKQVVNAVVATPKAIQALRDSPASPPSVDVTIEKTVLKELTKT